MKEEKLEPYTIKELLERAEEGQKQIALGNYTDICRAVTHESLSSMI